MQVAYTIRACQYGKGLFAAQNIPKGTLVWKLAPNEMKVFASKESFLSHLHSLASVYEKEMFMTYSMAYDANRLVYIWDDGKYTNHSDNPNIQRLFIDDKSLSTIETHSAFAIRDIKKGEEITQNYTIDRLEAGPQWWIDLSREYGVWLVHHNDDIDDIDNNGTMKSDYYAQS